MSRQAITTTYFGPTTHRGGRIKAKTTSGISIMVPWDYSASIPVNHGLAAMALAEKLKWDGLWVRGCLSGDADVFVWVSPWRPAEEITDYKPAFSVKPEEAR